MITAKIYLLTERSVCLLHSAFGSTVSWLIVGKKEPPTTRRQEIPHEPHRYGIASMHLLWHKSKRWWGEGATVHPRSDGKYMSRKGLADLGWFILCDTTTPCAQVIPQPGCFNCVNNFDVVLDGTGISWSPSRNSAAETVRVTIEEWLMSERPHSLLNPS